MKSFYMAELKSHHDTSPSHISILETCGAGALQALCSFAPNTSFFVEYCN